MSEEHGVKETKEALLALAALGGYIAVLVKDGVDLGDAVALAEKLATDDEFVGKLKAGVEGIDMIDDELSALDVDDVVDLVSILPALFEEIRKVKNA